MNEILFEQHEGIARITLNRPAVKNAMTHAMCDELAERLKSLQTDTSARVVVITGEGADFCVGADLKEMSSSLSPDPEQRAADIAQQVRDLSWPIFQTLSKLPQPIIASARGHAIGAGAQLILSADLCVCTPSLKFLMPQANLAHPVDHGESYFLPRKLGLAKAMQLTLLAETVGGEEATNIGLANWCVSDDHLVTATAEIAAKLAAKAPLALREIKYLMSCSFANTFEAQLAEEANAVGRCASTADFVEAITSFGEKRKPVFTGR